MVKATVQKGVNSHLKVDFKGIRMSTPLMAVSGIFGTDYTSILPGLPYLGAVVTKSITFEPRLGNQEPRIVETRAGLLNAIGLHNPGVHAFIECDIPKYRCLEIPVIASIAGKSDDDYVKCARLLSSFDEVHGFELNVSCPNVKNGVQFGSDACMLNMLVTKVKKVVGKKPLIVKLTPNVTDIAEPAQAAIDGGADALSLINTLHGMAIDLNSQRPKLGNIVGGLSGIGVHPIAVYMVHRCYTRCCKRNNIPIIGIGGVSTAEEALELILAGATCIGVGTAMFRQPTVFEMISKGMIDYLDKRCESSILSIVGRAAE